MESNVKDVSAQLGGIALATGLACLSQVVNSRIVEAVFGSIASNLASGYIDRLEYRKFQRAFLKGPHPSELNHDLQQVIVKAMNWTLQNLGRLYDERLTDESDKKRYRELVRGIRKAIDEKLVLVKRRNEDAVRMIDRPFDVEPFVELCASLETAGADHTEAPFADFVRANFSEHFQLCIGELLKHRDHRPAFIAYSRQLQRSMAEGLEEIRSQNRALLAHRTEGLATSRSQPLVISKEVVGAWFRDRSPEAEAVVVASLDALTTELKVQYGELLFGIGAVHDQVKLVASTTEETLVITTGFSNALREGWIHKHKAILLLVSVLLVAIVIFSIAWSGTRPWSMTLSLRPAPGLALSADYPPFSFPMQVSIEGAGRVVQKEAHTSLDIAFSDLVPVLLKEPVSLKVTGMGWTNREDSLRLKKGPQVIDMIPNDDLAFVEGAVRTWNGSAPVPFAQVEIGQDTIVRADANGSFKIKLPFAMRRRVHKLTVSGNGGSPVQEWYRPMSGPIAIRLPR